MGETLDIGDHAYQVTGIIEDVNHSHIEIEVLKSFLTQSANCLNSNGRLVIISYHSLEDRLTKNFFKKGFFRIAGNKELQQQLAKGWDEKQIRKTWENDLNNFKKIRKKYLIYP